MKPSFASTLLKEDNKALPRPFGPRIIWSSWLVRGFWLREAAGGAGKVDQAGLNVFPCNRSRIPPPV